MNFIPKMLSRFIPQKAKDYIRARAIESLPASNSEYLVHVSEIGKLSGRCVMVTGGNGAIGSAICHKLFIEGATVGVCGRNIEKVNQVISRIEAEKIPEKGVLLPVKMDVTDDNSISDAIDYFYKKAGRLDAFVNNAGGGARQENKLLFEQSIETIDRVLDTNLRGSIICARKASQIMVEQENGVIINLSSVVGMCGKAKMTDYAAAKAGIIGFTQSLAIELGKYNIRVNCVSPGMVNQVPFDANLPEKRTDANWLGRYGYTDEVAGMIAFIISDEAKYITGHNFVVDGGRSLGLKGD